MLKDYDGILYDTNDLLEEPHAEVRAGSRLAAPTNRKDAADMIKAVAVIYKIKISGGITSKALVAALDFFGGSARTDDMVFVVSSGRGLVRYWEISHPGAPKFGRVVY